MGRGNSGVASQSRPDSELGDPRLLGGDELQQRRLAGLGLLDAALDRRLDLVGRRSRARHSRRTPSPCRRSCRRCRSSGTSRSRSASPSARSPSRSCSSGTDRMGMRSRTAVSKSMPVKPIAASPQKLMQSLVRLRQLGTHRQAETHAKLRGLAPADIGHRLGGHPERRDLVARAAGVVRDDGVLRIGAVPSVPRSPDTG